MACKYKQFSKMEWLDELVNNNLQSEGRNPTSDMFYDVLVLIKKAQNSGMITNELFASLNSWKGIGSVEYGYYMANIHYDLYFQKSSTDLENRIIDFLKVSDHQILSNSEWFIHNFINELKLYVMCDTNFDIDISAEEYLRKYGNLNILIILNEYLNIKRNNLSERGN